jgi:hypothetical protein
MNIRYGFILALAVLLILPVAMSIGQDSREVKQAVPLDSDGKVIIDTYKGSIRIETWDKPEVNITAYIEADGSGHHEQRKVDETEIRIHGSGRQVKIQTDYSEAEHHGCSFFGLFSGDNGSMPFVHYTITVPATARLQIKDYKSETSIKNLKGSVRMETYKGSVDIVRQEGPVDLETYKGDVKIDYANYAGTNSFETYKGKIELNIPAKSGFDLDADIGRHGEFETDFNIDRSHKSRHDETYNTTVNGGGSTLRISTEKGDIRVRSR